MQISEGVPLAPLTTLGLGGPARRFARAESLEDIQAALAEASHTEERLLVLGGGSNLVVNDAGFDGLVLAIATQGVTIGRDGVVIAKAGVDWDHLVAQTIDAGLAGFECMSGIPGKVGATPMQNVGAYGQEISDTLTVVRAIDRLTGDLVSIGNRDCDFAYRSSRFRGSDRWLITEVQFQLEPSEQSKPIAYAELKRELGERAPLAQVRDTVIRLRRGKGMVVDAADPDSRSAGSFFTNPIVDAALAATLPDAPQWAQPDGRVKLSAAWLIERAGFTKGHAQGAVAISTKHALALVNRGGTTRELLALAGTIQDTVRERLGISLHPEPIIV